MVCGIYLAQGWFVEFTLNVLVSMGRDSIIARSFMRKYYEHKEDFQDIDTNKNINILDFDTFFKIKRIQ